MTLQTEGLQNVWTVGYHNSPALSSKSAGIMMSIYNTGTYFTKFHSEGNNVECVIFPNLGKQDWHVAIIFTNMKRSNYKILNMLTSADGLKVATKFIKMLKNDSS